MGEKNDKDGVCADRRAAVGIAKRLKTLLDSRTISRKGLEQDGYDGSEPLEEWLRKRNQSAS